MCERDNIIVTSANVLYFGCLQGTLETSLTVRSDKILLHSTQHLPVPSSLLFAGTEAEDLTEIGGL